MIDDDSDIFCTETNDTSNNHLNDDDRNQLQLKLHIFNYFLLSNPITDDLINFAVHQFYVHWVISRVVHQNPRTGMDRWTGLK